MKSPDIFKPGSDGKRRHSRMVGMQHDVVVITSKCAETIDKIVARAIESELTVAGPGLSKHADGKTHLRTLLICPDGYLGVTANSEELYKRRVEFTRWLKARRFPGVQWAALTFGAVQSYVAAVTDSCYSDMS